jgi:phosphatidylglycerophosphate synthase
MADAPLTRRPLKVRDTRWAAATARWLTRVGFRPNTISILGSLFALGAGAAFVGAGLMESWVLRTVCLLAAAAGIQLRLLCNLFDGMVAVEGGFRTKSGEIYNELPDRFSDAFILAGAGHYSLTCPCLNELGWAAATLAVITAYVRALGASTGAGQFFIGPMAKQHRMALMTAACAVEAAASAVGYPEFAIGIALAIIVLGCLITIARRSIRIARTLEGL